MPERDRGHCPDPVEFGILGSDHAHGDVGRPRRLLRRHGQHHQRVRVDVQARLGGGRRHLGRGLLDPLEGLGDDQLALPGADGTDVGDSDARPRAAPGPGVVRPARASGNEEYERPLLVGSGPAPRDGVTERVNPLNDLVSSHPDLRRKPCPSGRKGSGAPRSGGNSRELVSVFQDLLDVWAPACRAEPLDEDLDVPALPRPA